MAGYDLQKDLEVLREHYQIFSTAVRAAQRNWDVTNVDLPPDVKNFMLYVTSTNPFAGRRIIPTAGQGGPDWWHMAEESAIDAKPRDEKSAGSSTDATGDSREAAQDTTQDPDIRFDPSTGRKILWSPTRKAKQLPEPDMTGLDPVEKKKVLDDLLRKRAQKHAHDKRAEDRDGRKYAMRDSQAWWDRVAAQMTREEKNGQ